MRFGSVNLRNTMALILWETVSLAMIAAGAVFLFDTEGPVGAGVGLTCAGVTLGAYPLVSAYKRRKRKGVSSGRFLAD
jgi:hypothetical protein